MKRIAINKSVASLLISIFYGLAAAVQLLVILKVIPYKWVNGGMSGSYETQAIQSAVSIVIIVALYIFVRKIEKMGVAINKRTLWALYVITLFWTLGLFMQMFGTAFERLFLSPLLLLGVISHALLIIRVHSTKSH